MKKILHTPVSIKKLPRKKNKTRKQLGIKFLSSGYDHITQILGIHMLYGGQGSLVQTHIMLCQPCAAVSTLHVVCALHCGSHLVYFII